MGLWLPTRSDTNQPVQSQKQARSFTFRTRKEEGLYYPCSENKDADHSCAVTAQLIYAFFRIGKLLVFLYGGSYYYTISI